MQVRNDPESFLHILTSNPHHQSVYTGAKRSVLERLRRVALAAGEAVEAQLAARRGSAIGQCYAQMKPFNRK